VIVDGQWLLRVKATREISLSLTRPIAASPRAWDGRPCPLRPLASYALRRALSRRVSGSATVLASASRHSARRRFNSAEARLDNLRVVRKRGSVPRRCYAGHRLRCRQPSASPSPRKLHPDAPTGGRSGPPVRHGRRRPCEVTGKLRLLHLRSSSHGNTARLSFLPNGDRNHAGGRLKRSSA